jgi:hypothetical protein
MFVRAWSPVRRFNAGWIEVHHPGDYATINSYQPSDGTIHDTHSSVIAVTRGLNSEVRASLKQTAPLSFPLIDDTDGVIAEQFGLRWSLSDLDLIDAEMGMDLVSFRGTRPWILPMQARYLIRQDGVIAFANVAFDYDQRSEPAAILPALSRLTGLDAHGAIVFHTSQWGCC